MDARAHVARSRAASQTAAAARSAVRPVGAGSRLHQGLSARRPRERRPVHARRGLGRDGAGAARQRRRGRRAVPHAEPDQPHAHRRATSTATRRSRTSIAGDVYARRAARRPRRLELVHGIGRRGCIAPASKASSACGAAATTFVIDPCIPSSWPGYEIAWRPGDGTAVRDHRVQPGAPLPRRRVSGRGRRRRSTPRRFPSSTTAGCTVCGS